MDRKTVYDAICNIDEDHLDGFEDDCRSVKKHSKTVKQLITVTTCFLFVITAGIMIGKNDIFTKKPQSILPDTVTYTSDKETSAANPVEDTSAFSEATTAKQIATENQPEKTSGEINTEPIKGGDTPEFIQNHELGPDGVSYYRVFHPLTDTFDPLDEMTLENRFCSFTYNNKNYYPAPDGEITKDDYEPDIIDSERATHFELRTPDEEVQGIVYAARIDIYKLKGISPDEAIACVISFNGEKKEYKYLSKDITYPSYP